MNKQKLDLKQYASDCEHCYGLCCVALPYAKSADFAFSKDGGTPCQYLQGDYRCGIHSQLRERGLRGCTVYECFGAGQKVSQIIYKEKDWRTQPELAKEMFEVFPIVQQLHEMLNYLNEALHYSEAGTISGPIRRAIEETEELTLQSPVSLLQLNVSAHRSKINELLLETSRLVRLKYRKSRNYRGHDLIGAKLKGAALAGADLRGTLLIAADLRQANLRDADLIGADLRDANLCGADLRGSIFLTQAQVNSARGDIHTRLSDHLHVPAHWNQAQRPRKLEA